jgi:hypothetical protein
MICEHCGRVFDPKHAHGRFCKPACRAASWHNHRQTTLEQIDAMVEQTEAILGRAREAIRTLRKAKRP